MGTGSNESQFFAVIGEHVEVQKNPRLMILLFTFWGEHPLAGIVYLSGSPRDSNIDIFVNKHWGPPGTWEVLSSPLNGFRIGRAGI